MKTLRERKKDETRRRLAVAAVEILAEVGEEGATVAAIADRAGVSTRTFHNYFQKREDAYFHFLEVVTQQWRETLESLPPEDGPVRNLRDILVETITPRDGYVITPASFIHLGEHLTMILGHDERICAKSLLRDFEAEMVGRYEGMMPEFEVMVLLPAVLAGAGTAVERTVDRGEDPRASLDAAFDFLESRFGG